jgi:hypothetical protein
MVGVGVGEVALARGGKDVVEAEQQSWGCLPRSLDM